MIQHLGDPAIFTLLHRYCGFLQHGFSTAHKLYIAHRGLFRWQWVKLRWIALIPTKIVLVDRLAIMAQGPVVATKMKIARQTFRELQALSNFSGGITQIGKAHCLVMGKPVHILLLLHLSNNSVMPPGRPVMAVKEHLHIVQAINRLANILAPKQCITHLGATQRQYIVHHMGEDLGTAKGLFFRQVKG